MWGTTTNSHQKQGCGAVSDRGGFDPCANMPGSKPCVLVGFGLKRTEGTAVSYGKTQRLCILLHVSHWHGDAQLAADAVVLFFLRATACFGDGTTLPLPKNLEPLVLGTAQLCHCRKNICSAVPAEHPTIQILVKDIFAKSDLLCSLCSCLLCSSAMQTFPGVNPTAKRHKTKTERTNHLELAAKRGPNTKTTAFHMSWC